MTSYVDNLLIKHVKLSSIDEAKLTARLASLDDSMKLLTSLSREFDSQSSSAKFYESVGVVAILTSLVSDILRDTLGASLSKSNMLMKLGLEKIYDQARDAKWQDNRYKSVIDSIKKNGGYLETLAKFDKTGMTQMAITVHKNMLQNAVGLVGFMEDSKESRMALGNAIRSLQKNIETLESQRQGVQFYLDTGAGAPPQQRFTPQAIPAKLH
ncbi:hypothetical protein [Rugamonas sp.]|uniref:hypothetical protein n=1 Tax=Rugamonas sp. TaxID=1926287 RepID=UPI0025D6EE2E|nr:hypothetical protein [Rugamonas sp.]